MMNRTLRKILLPLPALVRWYLTKKRTYKAHNLILEIFPGVFHPGFFFSSEMLVNYLSRQALREKRLLEIGGGSGMISLYAAQAGANVVVTDISPQAIANIRHNAKKNQIHIDVIESDLFTNVKGQFDWIVVNPPYYPRNPVTESDHAWYCGANHEYFSRFFEGLRNCLSPGAKVVMVLSDVCDLLSISVLAGKNHFELVRVEEKRVWADGLNYIFEIKPFV